MSPKHTHIYVMANRGKITEHILFTRLIIFLQNLQVQKHSTLRTGS